MFFSFLFSSKIRFFYFFFYFFLSLDKKLDSFENTEYEYPIKMTRCLVITGN